MRNNNISFLRFLAIVAIVMHHSQYAFCGWPPNHPISCNYPLWTFSVSMQLKMFGLSAFTFISGYLLYNQNKKQENFQLFLWKKIKRILIPCALFAVLYGMFFSSFMCSNWPDPINGTHLWYLPMLFICILICSIDLFISRFSILYMSILWISMYGFYFITHLSTFNMVFYFFPVFIIGYWFNKYHVIERLMNCYLRNHLLLCVGGVICCLSFCCVFENTVFRLLQKIIVASSALIITCALRRNTKLGKITTLISDNSFSIYLIHQFVINVLVVVLPFRALGFYISYLILLSTSLFIPIAVSLMYEKILYNKKNNQKCYIYHLGQT